MLFSQKSLEQFETKLSKLREEFVNTKENLNKTQLDKDVLEQEKAEIGKKKQIQIQVPFYRTTLVSVIGVKQEIVRQEHMRNFKMKVTMGLAYSPPDGYMIECLFQIERLIECIGLFL